MKKGSPIVKHAVLLPLLFIVSMGVTYALFKASINRGASYTQVGQLLPEFELTTLDGQVVKSTDLKGKVTVINFFATWCEPCRFELPLLKSRAWDRFEENDRFALFVVGWEHTQEELADFKREQSFVMPLVPDPDGEIYGRFAAGLIPRTYVVDSNGKIAFQSIGYEAAEFGLMVMTVDALLRELDRSYTAEEPSGRERSNLHESDNSSSSIRGRGVFLVDNRARPGAVSGQ